MTQISEGEGLSSLVNVCGEGQEPTQEVQGLNLAPGLTRKHYTRLDRRFRDKHLSLLGLLCKLQRKNILRKRHLALRTVSKKVCRGQTL